MNDTITIEPNELNLKCCYTLLEPASHHDPDTGIGANINLYRRQLVRLPYEARGRALTADWHDKIAKAFPIPVECEDLFFDEPFTRFVGIALMKVFIENYGKSYGGDDWGQGLFTGLEAYKRLQNRMELAGPRAANLKDFWSLLIRDMKVDVLGDNTQLFQLLALPSGCHHEVLYHLEKHAPMIVEMARYWLNHEKLANEDYAKNAKKEKTSGDTVTLQFTEETDTEILESSVPIPTHSGNDIRHDIRYAGMVHLFAKLGFDLNTELPTGVKALFENGGNIAKGKSAPSTDYALKQIIRKNYPILGLLGGCTDTFMLGDGNLQSVSVFWEGRENNEALKHIFGVTAEHSVVDMLDNWTLHRHVGRYDGSPMPYSFETVAAGARLYVNFQFSPYTPELELGAFYAALETYQKIDASIGGQSAKGFGKVKVDILDGEIESFVDAFHKYEDYLEYNKEALAFGLKKGFLCTETLVCS